jgi:hypothetical protein
MVLVTIVTVFAVIFYVLPKRATLQVSHTHHFDLVMMEQPVEI